MVLVSDCAVSYFNFAESRSVQYLFRVKLLEMLHSIVIIAVSSRNSRFLFWRSQTSCLKICMTVVNSSNEVLGSTSKQTKNTFLTELLFTTSVSLYSRRLNDRRLPRYSTQMLILPTDITHEMSRVKGETVPVHAIKAYGGNRSIFPLILNLGATRICVIATLRPLYPQEKQLYSLNRRLDGSQSPSER